MFLVEGNQPAFGCDLKKAENLSEVVLRDGVWETILCNGSVMLSAANKLNVNKLVTLEKITPGAEDLIERACRTCYLSFHRYDPPKSTEELIKKILRKKHHSVLEHAHATFRIKGGSRVFTHELVRHRFISPSQESQRYVCYADKPGRQKTKDFEFVTPPTFIGDDFDFTEKYKKQVDLCYQLYEKMLDAGIPPEDARYILPNGTTSEIVITANFRELRHFFWVRTNQRAHWEIRLIAIEMLKIMKREAPIVFGDFVIDEKNMSATGEIET
ncbi:MAG: thymidylate synthase (FAD) [candidate division Zixibacteria bacterium 4484_95]|nr:MAG: thymidylate synthase (FAD) [candidate division Zixibacteria bacterium 4484_95]